MKLSARSSFIFFLVAFTFYSTNAQLPSRIAKPVKKSYPRKTNLSLGGGYGQSVIFLSRNVKENNNADGYVFNAVYEISNLFRASAEFTYYKPINIDLTWQNIHAQTYELNGQVIARVNGKKTFFYPLFGVSINHFSGFFTGKNDFLNVGLKYPANSWVNLNWLGFNAGTGFEQAIGRFRVYAEYKMRVGFNDGFQHHINVMDVCLGCGIRYNIRVPSIYKIFKGGKDRYFLDLEKN